MKSYSKQVKAKERRKAVIERLREQLRTGMKPEFIANSKGVFKQTQNQIPLTEDDIQRIAKELETLHERI